jgi:hypothetical protein
MLRRASLALAHHVTRIAEAGHRVPDLRHKSDTYWKDWLRLGPSGGRTPDRGLGTAADAEATSHVRVAEALGPCLAQRKGAQDKKRRGGQREADVAGAGQPPQGAAAVARYPEVRGLRFVPETRMYLDRDKSSALAIGRLGKRGQKWWMV